MIICIKSSFSKVEKLFCTTAERRSVYLTPPSAGFALVLNPGLILMKYYLNPLLSVFWKIFCFLQQQWMVHFVLILVLFLQ